MHLLFSQKVFSYDFKFLHVFLSNQQIRISQKQVGAELGQTQSSLVHDLLLFKNLYENKCCWIAASLPILLSLQVWFEEDL